MLFVGGVGFYNKITFLTSISRSKVIRMSKSYDMFGQGHWSFSPTAVKIRQVTTELHVQTSLTERKKKKKKKKNLSKKEQDALCAVL